MEYRVERDSMGEMKVPADRYWGAQTQRSKPDSMKAETIFNRIKDLAVVSPFQFKELASYTKQLSAYSIPYEE